MKRLLPITPSNVASQLRSIAVEPDVVIEVPRLELSGNGVLDGGCP